MHDLVLLDNRNPVTIALTQPQAVFQVNLVSDESDANINDGVCDINLGTGGDQCTFRAAIEQANASPGQDDIRFDSLVNPTIAPVSPLPVITDPVRINTLSGPFVELTGSNPDAASSHGLEIHAGSSAVHRMVINRFNGSTVTAGVMFHTSSNNNVLDCMIGTDRAGTADLGNGIGIRMFDSSNNSIGQSDSTSNLISGNIIGIQIEGISEGNVISHNRIGTTSNGLSPLGNSSDGIFILPSSDNYLVLNNTISANGGNGIKARSNGVVQDNRIGVNINGNAALGNNLIGVGILGNSNFIERNIVSGNISAEYRIRETTIGSMIALLEPIKQGVFL